tara:strand:+ start:3964 stop:4623 length:660 start_codon:yes stop_codon:yes gene_type:complete
MNEANYKYKIYGRLKGRKKTTLLNEEFYNKFIIDFHKDIRKNKKIILDIGSGSGENSIYLAKKNPNALIIACEIFLDGNINLCNEIYKHELKNVKLYDNNVIKFLDNLTSNNLFNEIWILFPDPWPKIRHQKRRLINIFFFKRLFNLLKTRGIIYISTDSASYLNSIIFTIYKTKKLFRWSNDKPHLWKYEFQNLANTKFYKKAKKSNRQSFFIELKKI